MNQSLPSKVVKSAGSAEPVVIHLYLILLALYVV